MDGVLAFIVIVSTTPNPQNEAKVDVGDVPLRLSSGFESAGLFHQFSLNSRVSRFSLKIKKTARIS